MTRCKDNLFFIKKIFEEKKCFRDRLEKKDRSPPSFHKVRVGKRFETSQIRKKTLKSILCQTRDMVKKYSIKIREWAKKFDRNREKERERVCVCVS